MKVCATRRTAACLIAAVTMLSSIPAACAAATDLPAESLRLSASFPPEVACTHPQGGMFLWATMPEGTSARKLLDLAVKEKVLFVPGDPFYIGKKDSNTMRLNFTCSNEEEIRTGIKRLGNAMHKLLK